MDPNTVFRKTPKGQQEVDQRSGALSMLERRVLILTDARRPWAQLQKLSRVPDLPQVMAKLTRLHFVEPITTAAAEPVRPAQPALPEPAPEARSDPAPAPTPAFNMGSINTEAQDFMVNMLLAFTDRTRVANLSSTIAQARTDGELKQLVNDWYAALADSANGVSEADGLKARLMEMLLLGSSRANR